MEKGTVINESMSKISSAIEEQNQIIWENEAYIDAYTKRNEQLQEEIKKMQEEIKRADKEITEIQPEIEKLNFCYDSELKTVELMMRSQFHLELLRDHELQHLNDLKKKEIDFLQQYKTLYDETKELLQDSSESYNELVVKKRELKRAQFNCRFWEKEIQEIREKNAMNLWIRQKVFCQDIVKFASAWLEKKKEAEKSRQKFKALKMQAAVLKAVPRIENRSASTSFPIMIASSSSSVLAKVGDVPNQDPLANIRNLMSTPSKQTQSPQLLTLTSKLKEIEMKKDCAKDKFPSKIRILDMQTVRPQIIAAPKNYNTILKKASQRVSEKLSRKRSMKGLLNNSMNLSQSSEIAQSQPMNISEEAPVLSQSCAKDVLSQTQIPKAEPMEISLDQTQQKPEEGLKEPTQETDVLTQSQNQPPAEQQPEETIPPDEVSVSQKHDTPSEIQVQVTPQKNSPEKAVTPVEDSTFVKPQDLQKTPIKIARRNSAAEKEKSFTPQFNFGRGSFNFGSKFGKIEDKKELFNPSTNLFGPNNDDALFQVPFSMQNRTFDETFQMDFENANCSFKDMVSEDKDENEKEDGTNKTKDFQFGQSFFMNMFN